jgi:HD-GYP domain-containing protein (c-di-GMP phosphodiesterase class II)
MTTDRSYRKALPLEVALGELRKHAGTQFDPAVVTALVSLVAEAPEPGWQLAVTAEPVQAAPQVPAPHHA